MGDGTGWSSHPNPCNQGNANGDNDTGETLVFLGMRLLKGGASSGEGDTIRVSSTSATVDGIPRIESGIS